MKHSVIYRLIMSFFTLIYSYYKESYSKKVINRLFNGLREIYSTSLLYRILSIKSDNSCEIRKNSILTKTSNLIDVICRYLRAVYQRGIKGSKLIELDESLMKNLETMENRIFLIIICTGSLITYNILKLMNNGFSKSTVIVDVIILVIILNIRFLKISTTLKNSFLFRIGRGFVIQPRGDLNDE